MCSITVSSHETVVSDGFLTLDVTCDPWKWVNTVPGTGIKSSCVGIGQKLISVGRKTSTTMVTMVMTFPTFDLGFFKLPTPNALPFGVLMGWCVFKFTADVDTVTTVDTTER